MMILADLLTQVYIPLESRHPGETCQALKKLVSQVKQYSSQVSGTVNIDMPSTPDEHDEESARKNKELHVQYENYLESWTNTIK